MWTWLFIVLFAATGAAWWMHHRRQKREIFALDKARERIQVEEARVFDFLHGLGEALSAETRPDELHRLIVDGAMRVAEADGGALYLVEKVSQVLRPAFVSKGCSPLLTVPEGQRHSREAVLSWLRLRAVSVDEGVLGSAWREGTALLLRGDDSRLTSAGDPATCPGSAMIAPLFFANQKLGILVVTRPHGSEPFPTSAFELFKAIAEQSAFALHTLFVFSEAAEKRRLDEDLQVAKEIQRILLPVNAPEVRGFQISGVNLPARQVSGDYYDYLVVDDHRMGVAIADVSGKGVPASLIMAMCRSVLRSQAAHQRSPAEVLSRVNEQIYPDIKEDMFISMAYAILDEDSPDVIMCRAGHDAPLVYRASENNVVKVNPPGMALGIDSGGVFNRVTGDFTLKLDPGDCLILYTDGITEALDRAGEEFGLERVIKAILSSASQGAAGILTRLTDDLRAFVGPYPQHDDITLIVIRKKNE
jgi:phosphoserine phosphatase RsbU/P